MDRKHLTKFRQTTTGAEIRQKRQTSTNNNNKQKFLYDDIGNQQSTAQWNNTGTGTNFRRSRSTEWDKEGPSMNLSKDVPSSNRQEDNLNERTMRRKPHQTPVTNFNRAGAFHMNTASRPSMKTLDKKISVSSDQLHTLTTDQKQEKFAQLKAGLSRASYRQDRESDLSDGDVIFKYKGANYSKNEYFFGDNTTRRSKNVKCSVVNKVLSDSNLNQCAEDLGSNGFIAPNEDKMSSKKTPYQMFLEDDGPYSRKLYGPLKQSRDERNNQTSEPKLVFKNIVHKSKEYLSLDTEADSPVDLDTCQVKKGLLWHQRDKLFSRWKERFFILTKDYLHCFKKDSSRISEMGEFIFKSKLVDIEGVSLLDKRGYLTICISQNRDGRMYLRKNEGIRDWFSLIQSSVYESKRRRKFWVKRQPSVQINSHLSSIYGIKNSMKNFSNVITEEDCAADDEDEGSDTNNNIPKGINRLSLVSDLLMSEVITNKKSNEEKNKIDQDSGHDSGQSSINTGSGSLSESSG